MPPIVNALVRRGHRVSYAGLAPFIARVAAVGAEVVEYSFGAVTAKNVDENSFCLLAMRTLAAPIAADRHSE